MKTDRHPVARSLIQFMILVAAVCAVPALAQAPGPGVDISKLNDPPVQAAVAEILRKQAAIHEFTAGEMIEQAQVGVKTTNQVNVKIMFRAPNLLFMTRTTVGGPLDGQTSAMLLDENFMWKIDTPSPAMLKSAIDSIKKSSMSQAEMEKEIAHRRATYTKVDLAAMREAGLVDIFYEPFKAFLAPVKMPPLSKWTLETETPTEWVFLIKAPKTQTRLVYSKESGLCLRLEVNRPPMSVFTQTLGKFTINPATPIPDATFKYEPPPDAKFKDITNEMLDIVNRKKQDRNTSAK